MSLETSTGTRAPAPLPLQFISIELMPTADGKFSVAMQATLLDEQELEFVGQDLGNEHVETLDQAVAVIRKNVAALARAA